LSLITLDKWAVLVVDDERDNRQLLTDVLDFFGAQVTAVSSGREAMQAVEENAFRLVLLDIQMPLVDGLDVIQFIRGSDDPHIKHLMVVAVTAEAMPGDRERILAKGFDGYVAKPLDALSFANVITEIVENKEKM
ncbi:MAG TPA: response regulator, partial [Aggregatilineales bacterium]|nr:response regulator [Aggregatilineales bacterium]